VTEAHYKKKLIEVALPLDEINAACKADKDRKTGTLRNIHKWFAPMPLPAWRALLFAALVNDPEDDNQRVYLLDLIKRLVSNGADLPDATDVAEAQAVLRREFPHGTPTVFDPFCGGGSTLVEAQRLGLSSYGSDLNPVPALISRTISELLPKLRGAQPVRPNQEGDDGTLAGTSPITVYDGLDGVAEDIRYYAAQILVNVEAKIENYFPRQRGERPVAWIWGRSAQCVNPACGAETILATTWWLSKKPGELAWIVPEVADGAIKTRVVSSQRSGSPGGSPKASRGANFSCLACSALLDEKSLIEQGKRGEIRYRLLAIASTLDGRRSYRSPSPEEERVALGVPVPENIPQVRQPDNPRWFSGPRFGFETFADMFTPRQLMTLSTFANEVALLHESLTQSGVREEQAAAITTVLGLAVGQMARFGSTLSQWRLRSSAHAKAEAAFARADMQLMWDFAETYFKSGSVGDWLDVCESVIRSFPYMPNGNGAVVKVDARTTRMPTPGIVATDPPYFDAIGYADLSDYFYMWHRLALRNVHPDLYATIATPKAGELTAVPSHHGNSKNAARDYFIDGFTDTFANLAQSLAEGLPMLVVYASKEQKGGAEEETRWASILTAIVRSNLEITGTWPIHGTGSTRMVGIGTNAVATYIVMTCRPRGGTALTSSLADFNRALRRELGPAVRDLQAASILPVDLAQAAMGPGMRIFTRYRAVIDQSGQPLTVDHALRLINAALAEVLDEQEGELDPESRFAVRWWETHGWSAATFGEADKTARPLGISVDEVVRAQVVTSQANKVQLLGSGPLDRRWRPGTDVAPTAWEAVHHLVDRLVDGGGELDAARLMSELGKLQDSAMSLAYRLHGIAAKKGRTGDQERYNALINSWSELIRLAGDGNVTAEGLF
jgi:putative DNA methylase